MSLLAALSGAGIVVGVLLVLDGATRRERTAPRRVRSTTRLELPRLGLAAAVATTLLVVTRWPVAALAGAAAGWFAPDLTSSKASQQRAVARTEALATWTEMLRDTLAGAHGLEEAIVTSADVAPAPIETEVRALAERLRRQPIDLALAEFGRELAHPIGDLVVTALLLAASGSTGDLNELLGTLAVSARDEAGMRLRVEASRARLRTAVRVIALCTGTTALGLVVLSRRYLEPYGSATGQIVLLFVVAAWATALWWLARMGSFVAPERFLVHEEGRR
jgi:tight adherence protein B